LVAVPRRSVAPTDDTKKDADANMAQATNRKADKADVAKETNTNQSTTTTTTVIYLRIKGVQVFPEADGTYVHVRAKVNGIVYDYPSVGGVNWMEVGPSMGGKIIEIPAATSYRISFELQMKNGPAFGGRESFKRVTESAPQNYSSNIATPVTTLPFSENYNLYKVDGDRRGAAVGAHISYELSES
jgi:hypothetical protein